MGKISPVSAKYIIHATINIEGVVDRPDVIGAIFGQTEGLLGADLELRELQRSGRIGRIEVITETRGGKTTGSIVVPSSLDKAETAIVAAALEVIQRIGPCNAEVKVSHLEDVRISKRNFVVQRAKELLKQLMEGVLPDSQEIADEVTYSVRVMEIGQYGRDRLPAGPAIDESDEIIVVEGRADVLNLLKHGIKNVIAMNGTSVPQTIIELSKRKAITVFVDGDRGGDLIIKELLQVAEIDYVTKAPDGKEVEEITKKEIHKALRSKVASEQAKLEAPRAENSSEIRRPLPRRPLPREMLTPRAPRETIIREEPSIRAPVSLLSQEEKEKLRQMTEDLIGTRGAYLLDENMDVLAKVPIAELQATLKNAPQVAAVVFDGIIDKELAETAERTNVKVLVGMESTIRQEDTRIAVATINEL